MRRQRDASPQRLCAHAAANGGFHELGAGAGGVSAPRHPRPFQGQRTQSLRDRSPLRHFGRRRRVHGVSEGGWRRGSCARRRGHVASQSARRGDEPRMAGHRTARHVWLHGGSCNGAPLVPRAGDIHRRRRPQRRHHEDAGQGAPGRTGEPVDCRGADDQALSRRRSAGARARSALLVREAAGLPGWPLRVPPQTLSGRDRRRRVVRDALLRRADRRHLSRV